ncbi:type II toxin-antitoxin system VapC family toxin [Planktothrix pseudagardhii]|uniref:Ribonuclease VapC n=1 Tax=Planktothrix pseudagardhii TaxID=132604 RepID=A0A9W4CRH1_9CYAN|nr:type II toxin-antitoxin system VapC family toxin [Planktothrix pseudagardhii]CAD5981203.1 Ribonuclease VapC2 [Planktothrix pseudagardhii]
MIYLLDTNIVSLATKNNRQINKKLEDIKAQRKKICISCITYFEIRRGFLAVDSPKQRERFNGFCQDYQIILLDDLAILEKAAEIHANLRLRGLPIQTEDILIAATAIVKGLILVSNDSDLLRVEGLSLENWVE